MGLNNLPNTLTSGLCHRQCMLHYFPGGVKPSGQTDTQATANAIALAGKVDLIIGNVVENASTLAITSDKFQGNTAAMIAANPDLVMMPYNKSAQITESISYYPNNYYAHSGSWPNGPKITIFNASTWIAQPSVAAGQSSFADPRGWTATSFKEQRARDAWAVVARYNTLHGANQLQGAYLDSMNPFDSSIINPATNAPYTSGSIFNALVWSIGDETITRKPNVNYVVFGNGLGDGAGYFAANGGQDQIGHLDGGESENWLRGNNTVGTAFFTEAKWQKCINMIYDANVLQSKTLTLTVNMCNSTAGSNTCPGFTSGVLEQWRKYTLASYWFGKQTSTFIEFVENIGVKPWDEDHPYYNCNLGTQIDNPGVACSSLKTAGVYRRRYQLGCAWVNPTGSPVTITMDRSYQTPTGITPSASYAAGSTQVLPANSGLVLVRTGGSTIGSGLTAVSGTGSITIPLTRRVRMSGSTAVAASGAVSVLAVDGAHTSGSVAVSGTGTTAVVDTMRLRKSGTTAVSGTGAATIIAAVRQRLSGSLSVAGSGAITIPLVRLVRTSGSISVPGSGSVTISDSLRVRKSGTVSVAGSGATAISASLEEVLSGLLSVSGAGAIGVAAISINGVSDVVSGSLNVAGSGAVTVVSPMRLQRGGPVAVSGSGAVTLAQGVAVRLTHLIAVSATGVVTVTDTSYVRRSGTISVSGTGAAAISASTRVKNSGSLVLAGSGAVTVVSPVRVRMGGPLAVAATGVITVDVEGIRTSGTLTVSGSGAISVSDTLARHHSGTLAVVGAGAVNVASGTIIGVISEVTSGKVAVAGTGAAAISDSFRLRKSGVVSVAGSGDVSAAASAATLSGVVSVDGSGLILIVPPISIVESGELDVTGEALILSTPYDAIRRHDRIFDGEEYFRRFYRGF